MARSIYEKRAHQELLAEGYWVDYKIRPRICPRGYRIDFFGLFDLVAFIPGSQIMRWIAIKGVAGNRHLIIKEILNVQLPANNQKEIWWVNDVGVWRKEILT
jgi:hypothetical protein